MKQTYLKIQENFNPYSLITTIGLDLIWSLFEGGVFASVVGILFAPVLMGIIFIICFVIVSLVQHNVSGDNWQSALTKGLVLGFLASLPLSIVGTIFGLGYGLLYLIYGTDEETILLGKLTQEWRALERTIKNSFTLPRGSDGMEDYINLLSSYRIISASECDELHQIRKIRNTSTHTTTHQELASSIQRLRFLRFQVERRLKLIR